MRPGLYLSGMTTLAALWLPVLLSAVFVFVASSVIHMVLPMHKGDYKKMPHEDEVLAALRGKVPPGQYMFPMAQSMQEYSTPEMKAKFDAGPVGVMVLRPNGMPNMGTSLLQWFVLCIVISLVVAYLTGSVLAAGTEYLTVFRVAGTAALLGYAFSSVNDSIWKGVSWGTTVRFFIDGIVYALVTAGTFAWLWPSAAA